MAKLFDDNAGEVRDESREKIRVLFSKLGGNIPIRDLAHTVIDQDLLPKDKLQALLHSAVADECREALKQLTEEGLPYAKPVAKSKDGVWKQLDLMSYSELASTIEADAERITQDYERLLVLVRYCKKRFGKAPDIPKLVQLERA